MFSGIFFVHNQKSDDENKHPCNVLSNFVFLAIQLYVSINNCATDE